MIDFLKKCGITDLVINEIINVNSSTNLYNFSCNQDEIIKIIGFLKEIGVNCIEQLLVYRIDMFFVSLDKFKKIYIKEDVNSFVREVNEDYTVID